MGEEVGIIGGKKKKKKKGKENKVTRNCSFSPLWRSTIQAARYRFI